MTGKSHLLCNASVAVATGSLLWRSCQYPDASAFNQAFGEFFYVVAEFLQGDHMSPMWLWWTLAAFLFVLGTLLPDCDTKSSMIGRVFHLPFEHRTWTHTIWALALCYAFACFVQVGFYLFAGYALHLIFDAFSYGGICWFYPLSRYRTYPNGARVKKRHVFRLYRTGQRSEGIFDVVVFTACAVVVVTTVASVVGI